jgi:hypothetical protein
MVKSVRVIGLVSAVMIAAIIPSFAAPVAGPAPELGGTTLGIFLAGGIAALIRSRRKH